MRKIPPYDGWVLIASEGDDDPWHIAWLDVFGTRKEALAFAQEQEWPRPYRAVRGGIAVH